MEIAVTKKFVDDLKNLENELREKTKKILLNLVNINLKQLKFSNGLRVHNLENSKFKSFSINMNFRALALLENNTLIFHRVLKHDSAYRNTLLQNYDIQLEEETLKFVPSERDSNDIISEQGDYKYEANKIDITFEIKMKELINSIKDLCFDEEWISKLKEVRNENDFLELLDNMPNKYAMYILEIYQFGYVDINNLSYQIITNIDDFEESINDDKAWKLYLHPSQRYITELPVKDRVFIDGAAGTGKTICAVRRAQELLKQGYKIAFVLATNGIKNNIFSLMDYKDKYTIITPNKVEDIFQLANDYDHIIIDEGQEFSPTWYKNIISSCRINMSGITIFYDLNQMGSNIVPRDTKRYNDKLQRWKMILHTIPKVKHIKLTVNYRNSLEINNYCIEELNNFLPHNIEVKTSCFSTENVSEYIIKSEEHTCVILNNIVIELLRNYKEEDIMIIGGQNYLKGYQDLLKFKVNDNKIIDHKQIAWIRPRFARGYERKAVIFITPIKENIKVGQCIQNYIAMSRAKERLFVIFIEQN